MGTVSNLMRTSATLVSQPIATAEGFARFGNLLARRITATPQQPLDNAALHAASDRSPLVWLGGILTDPSHHKWDQIQWQKLGVPYYITDNGHGLRSAEQNAAQLRDTIKQALSETGANKVYVAAQSKGCVDTLTMLLDHPDMAKHIKGVFFHGGAFDGGFTTDMGKADALRGIVDWVDGKLPAKWKGGLDAARELTHGTPHLERLRARFPQFVANMPDDMHITNYVSHLKGTQRDGQAGHDLFIPKNSQQLPPFDATLPQARRIEVVDLGEHNHITTHQYGPTIEHMDRKMWELDNGVSQEWREPR